MEWGAKGDDEELQNKKTETTMMAEGGGANWLMEEAWETSVKFVEWKRTVGVKGENLRGVHRATG